MSTDLVTQYIHYTSKFILPVLFINLGTISKAVRTMSKGRLEQYGTSLEKLLKIDIGALINQKSLHLVAQSYTISVHCILSILHFITCFKST